jgi:hypothetical protein
MPPTSTASTDEQRLTTDDQTIMSVETTTNRPESIDSDQPTELALPPETRCLMRWLDEQPYFESFEYTDIARGLDSASGWGHVDRERTHLAYVAPMYDRDTRACYDSQADVADAWDDLKFPTHRISRMSDDSHAALLYTNSSFRTRDGWETEVNYSAHQYADGRGRIEHYGTTCAIRTRNGLVLANSQDYALGRARLTYPEYDEMLPLSSMAELLSAERLYDIVEVTTHEHPSFPYLTGTRLAHFSSGHALLIGRDETARNYHERTFGVPLDPDEAAEAASLDNPLDILMPDIVAQHVADGYEVVGSQDYGSPYRDGREGSVIVRQGEWFFVPTPDFEPDEYVRNTRGGADYDRTKRPIGERLAQLPNQCPVCEGTAFHYDTDDVVSCEAPDCDYETQIQRYDEEFLHAYGSFVYNTDTPLENHCPRDIHESADGTVHVRGTVRHRGSDHHMLNFDDWHLAVSSRFEGVVFDTSTPNFGRSRSRGGLRYD